MPERSNADVATAFHEIADLLELKGENRFRVLAYRRAADALDALSRDVGSMSEAELTAVSGVGKAVAAKVVEYVGTGRIATLEALRGEIPPGMRDLTSLPGLGPKRAMQLYRELGVSSVDELQKAVEEGRLEGVRGFGARFAEQTRKAIAEGVRGDQRILLARALPQAEAMLAELVDRVAVEAVAYAGSVRRMRETIGDIDLLVASDRPDEVMEAFRKLRGVRTSEGKGTTKTSVITTRGLQVDLRVVEPDVFGAALQYFTGSQAHNVKVRQHAVRKGLRLSEYGLFVAETDERLVSRTEEEVYERLGMQWIPPTMREDRGEVEAALSGGLPDVVVASDMRGDLQSHSTYSDGRLGVRDMALGAAERGLEYYAVTDHGPRLSYMRNLGPDDIVAQRNEIAALNRELNGRITVLHGIELNIDGDGGLDYPDDVLAGFDICVASIHSQFRLPKDEQTKRLVRAISNRRVHVVGHPSGRRLDRREGIDFDVAEVARAAAQHGVALEINAHPFRLDLRDEHVRWAKDTPGVRFAISTDAHSIAELDHMRFGVATAQRGWVNAGEVINTWPLERLRAFLAKGA